MQIFPFDILDYLLYLLLLQTQALSELAPSQVAELLLSSNVSNDTELIDRIFVRLEVGNPIENVDEFFTQLVANEQVCNTIVAPEWTVTDLNTITFSTQRLIKTFASY